METDNQLGTQSFNLNNDGELWSDECGMEKRLHRYLHPYKDDSDMYVVTIPQDRLGEPAHDHRRFLTENVLVIDPALSNIALGQRTEQSSTFLDNASDKAVDGNVDGAFSAKTMAHTNGDSNDWWQVTFDLAKVSKNTLCRYI